MDIRFPANYLRMDWEDFFLICKIIKHSGPASGWKQVRKRTCTEYVAGFCSLDDFKSKAPLASKAALLGLAVYSVTNRAERLLFLVHLHACLVVLRPACYYHPANHQSQCLIAAWCAGIFLLFAVLPACSAVSQCLCPPPPLPPTSPLYSAGLPSVSTLNRCFPASRHWHDRSCKCAKPV
jgi:hypothetical protein